MLTTYDLDEYIYDALEAGASGFLLKDVAAEELIRGVCECCCELRDAPILPPDGAHRN
jgi:DNA-binding NarL/FixJ family response regulator